MRICLSLSSIRAAIQQRTADDDDDPSVLLRETIGWHVAVPCHDLTSSSGQDSG